MEKGKVVVRAGDLSAVGLFTGLPTSTLEALIARSPVSRFARGDTALRQGTRSGELHVIVSGAFKAWSLTEGGAAVTLAVMGKNEVFGEMAFLDGGQHSANVSAMTPAYTLRVGASALDAVVQAHPSVRDYLARQLAARLRRLSMVSERMAVEDVGSRLARQLLELSERFGAPELGGTRIMLELSQQELGELVGATRERVNRVLMTWTKQGLISRRGKQVILLSRSQLSRCAGLTA
jgi:CRP-like cAMP-binding protein